MQFLYFSLREWLYFGLALLSGTAFLLVLGFSFHGATIQEVETRLRAEISPLSQKIYRGLGQAEFTSRGLATLVFTSLLSLGDIPNHSSGNATERMRRVPEDKFRRFSEEELIMQPSYVSIQTRPSGIITQVYPNSSAPVGLDLGKSRPSEKNASRVSDTLYISGPRMLAQGYPGMVTYWDVYLNSTYGDGPDALWWGSVGVVLNLARFMNEVGYGNQKYVTKIELVNLLAQNQNATFGPAQLQKHTVSHSFTEHGISVTITMEADVVFPPILVGVLCLVILVIIGAILGVFVVVYQKRRFALVVSGLEKKTRDVKNAPKNRVAIIFTDVQNSTLLWEKHPEEMRIAMATHHNMIRQVIQKHKAYEVKTIGDSFMIATDSADTALCVSNDIQSELLVLSWPEKILDTPDACVEFQGGKLVFKGLRVRIGIDIGNPEVVYDEVSKGYDYYGDVTNNSARVQGIAYGGQTLITKAVYTELSPAMRDPLCHHWVDVGEVALKGLTEKKHVYQALPKDLVRHFTVPQESSSCWKSSLGDKTTLSGPRRDIEEMPMNEIAAELRRFRAVMASAESKGEAPAKEEEDLVAVQEASPPQVPPND